MEAAQIKTSELDKRSFEIELRADQDTESRTVHGYAAVFNQWADIGWFREMIAPGAFGEAIDKSDIRALFNHDNNGLLARTKSGTLQVREDEKGLYFEFDLPAHRQDLLEMIKRGDLADCSFQFSMRDGVEEWRYNSEDDKDERIIKKVGRLYDIALVTFPAYEGTSVDLRSYKEYKSAQETETPDEAEQDTQENDESTLNSGAAKSRERKLTLLTHFQNSF